MGTSTSINRRPDPKKQRLTYFVLLGSCLLNVPIYLFLVRPVIQADEIVTVRAQKIRMELRQRRAVRDKLYQVENQMLKSRRRFQEFKENTLFSEERGNSDLLKELDTICSKSGLLKKRGVFQYDRESRFGTKKLIITLPIEGSYSNIRRLLNVLENRSKFIIIDSLNLEDTREGSGVIRMDLRLSTLIGATL